MVRTNSKRTAGWIAENRVAFTCLPGAERLEPERPVLGRGDRRRPVVALLSGMIGLALLNPGNSRATEEGVLHTGGGEPLATISLTLDLRDAGAQPRLQFNFGFGTDEVETPDVFYDSLSVTLETADQSVTALLLTADVLGVLWAPPNPGGLQIGPEGLSRQEIVFENERGTFSMAYAYAVSFLLPPELLGQFNEIHFDLFDNLNEFDSVGYFGGLEVVPTAAPPPVALTLQSSASVAGPYAEEDGFHVDAEAGEIRLPWSSSKRFFRLRSGAGTTIRSLGFEGNDLAIAYNFTEMQVTLQAAERVQGPYQEVSDAVIDLENRIIRAPRDGTARFYRLEANVQVRIVSVRMEEGELVLAFAWEPAGLVLQSSAQAGGPYADEGGVRNDAAAQVLRIPRRGAARYFRFTPGDPRRVTGLRFEGEDIVLTYEMVGGASAP